MGTGRGNQEILSEQRQNRGNLNYNTTCQCCRAHRGAILISSGFCGGVLMGLWGGLCTEQVFQTLQSRAVFLSVKRGHEEGKGNVHRRARGQNTETHKNLLSNVSDN